MLSLAVTHSLWCNTEIEMGDIAILKNYISENRSRNFSGLIEKLNKKSDKVYSEYYLGGLIYAKQNRTSEAINYFAMSAFTSMKPLTHRSNSSEIVSTLNNKFNRSPLYADAIYEIASLYSQTKRKNIASEILRNIDENEYKLMKRNLYTLQGDIIADYNVTLAIELYLQLLKLEPGYFYNIKIGDLYKAQKLYNESFEYYFKAISPESTSWIQSIAAQKIISLNTIYQRDLTMQQKVYLAEGLRLNKKYGDSIKLWKSIDVNQLEKNDLEYYLIYYGRLLSDVNQPSKLRDILIKYFSAIDIESQYKVQEQIAPLLYNKNNYKQILEIVSPDNNRANAALYRIKAIDKLNSPLKEIETAHYLQIVDKNSTYAENIYFKICFEKIIRNEIDAAKTCLYQLRDLTQNSVTGGRSRYFIAKFLEDEKKYSEADEMYKEVYLNSPSHYYAFAALASLHTRVNTDLPEENVHLSDSDENKIKTVAAYKKWITENFNDTEKMKLYFEQKKANKNFGMDHFWFEFENKINDLFDQLNVSQKRALLFYALGQFSRAQNYLADTEDRYLKYLIPVKAGLIVDDAYLSYEYMSAFLNYTDVEPDILLMGDNALRALFPTPYRDSVQKAGLEYHVEEAHIYALMKQESAFNPGVTSWAGAKGLMQIMPSTAKWMNKTTKIDKLNLFNPDHSIKMATKFYSWILQSNDFNFEKSAIAYNAGPGRLRQWMNDFKTNDMMIFVEHIPVDETYFYVQKTRRNYDRYKILFDYYYIN